MQKILFVGNSYTYYNDMPTALFVPKAEAAGFPCQVTAVTRGGWTLAKFADPNDEEGARLRSVVEGQQYDWVILQEQSCRPVVNKDAFFRGVEDLKTLLSPQTDRFLLYATWGRKPGSEKLEELGMTSEEMTGKLAEAYDEAGCRFDMPVAQLIGPKVGVTLTLAVMAFVLIVIISLLTKAPSAEVQADFDAVK